MWHGSHPHSSHLTPHCLTPPSSVCPDSSAGPPTEFGPQPETLRPLPQQMWHAGSTQSHHHNSHTSPFTHALPAITYLILKLSPPPPPAPVLSLLPSLLSFLLLLLFHQTPAGQLRHDDVSHAATTVSLSQLLQVVSLVDPWRATLRRSTGQSTSLCNIPSAYILTLEK